MKTSSPCLQRIRSIIALAFGLLIAACGASSAADAPTTRQIRDAVQRSIPFIQKKGVWWIDKKNCVSCHRVNNMIWSLGEARRNGFEVSDQLDEWVKWATDSSLSKNEKGTIVGLGNKEGVAQLLLAPGTETADERKELAALLLDGQQADGSWPPGGQLPSQKRPAPETAAVSTMWITLALTRHGDSEESNAAVKKAMQYVAKSPAGTSIEWHTTRLLLAVEQKDHPARDRIVETIRERQQADGGWAWRLGGASDALGTGLAVHALTHAGFKPADPSIRRARDYLLKTQRKDGSWAVNGTKSKKKGSVQETATYWGTTWAGLALIAVLNGEQSAE
jgi:squalene cyclase